MKLIDIGGAFVFRAGQIRLLPAYWSIVYSYRSGKPKFPELLRIVQIGLN